MAKRIISSLLAFVLLITSLFMFGVAIINVIELLGETIGRIVVDGFDYFLINCIFPGVVELHRAFSCIFSRYQRPSVHKSI
jgi:hypothetical protein